jgi:hypothetical protein
MNRGRRIRRSHALRRHDAMIVSIRDYRWMNRQPIHHCTSANQPISSSGGWSRLSVVHHCGWAQGHVIPTSARIGSPGPGRFYWFPTLFKWPKRSLFYQNCLISNQVVKIRTCFT